MAIFFIHCYTYFTSTPKREITASDISHHVGLVFWYISKVMAILCNNLDGVRIVLIRWFWYQRTVEITNIRFDILPVADASNLQNYEIIF